MWHRRRRRGAGRWIASLVLLAGLLGGLGWVRDRMKQSSDKTVGAATLWLIGGSMIGFGLLMLLLTIGSNWVAGLGVGFTFCLFPGALALFAGWMAYRAGHRFEVEPLDSQESASRSGVKVSPLTYDPGKSAPKPSYYRERAAAYRRRIESVIRNRRAGPLADWLKTILPKLQGWEDRVGQLGNRLAAFESDGIIQRDIREVPTLAARLRRQMEVEADPLIRDAMARTLQGYEAQQSQLEALIRLMRRTRLQLDDTLASMGIIYSQVQLVDAADLDSARTDQISGEIEEQVNRLGELLTALTDVYQQPEDISETARRIRLQRGETAR
jgi:hypothetical protein